MCTDKSTFIRMGQFDFHSIIGLVTKYFSLVTFICSICTVHITNRIDLLESEET